MSNDAIWLAVNIWFCGSLVAKYTQTKLVCLTLALAFIFYGIIKGFLT